MKPDNPPKGHAHAVGARTARGVVLLWSPLFLGWICCAARIATCFRMFSWKREVLAAVRLVNRARCCGSLVSLLHVRH